jgi:hypothetical protein
VALLAVVWYNHLNPHHLRAQEILSKVAGTPIFTFVATIANLGSDVTVQEMHYAGRDRLVNGVFRVVQHRRASFR